MYTRCPHCRTVFSLGATALQRVLAERLLVSPMMEATSPAFGGTLLLVAGVYQMTPLKHLCLRACHSPFGFLMGRWRPGNRRNGRSSSFLALGAM